MKNKDKFAYNNEKYKYESKLIYLIEEKLDHMYPDDDRASYQVVSEKTLQASELSKKFVKN